jgi:hypothetical protein
MIGVLVFLLSLLLAVQVLVDLYATSAVTAAAYDGARIVAGADGQADVRTARSEAERRIVTTLGRFGRDRVALTWKEDPSGRDVVLNVRAENPSFLPAGLRRPMGLDAVERTVHVRIEAGP